MDGSLCFPRGGIAPSVPQHGTKKRSTPGKDALHAKGFCGAYPALAGVPFHTMGERMVNSQEMGEALASPCEAPPPSNFVILQSFSMSTTVPMSSLA